MVEDIGNDMEAGEDSAENLAERASDLFWRVSEEYPGKGKPQSLAIALECLGKKQEPKDLLKALLNDKDSLGDLARRANDIHQATRRENVAGVEDSRPGPPLKLNEKSMAAVVTVVFNFAQESLAKPPEELRQELGEYSDKK